MTGRERILSRIHGGEVDRIPVSPFIWSNFVRCFFREQLTDLVGATVVVYDRFGFDIVHRTATPQMYLEYEREQETPHWKVDHRSIPFGENSSLEELHFITSEGTLKRSLRYTRSGFDELVFTEQYPLQNSSDLELLERYQPPVPCFDVSVIDQAREAVGEKGIVAPWIQGVFNLAGIFYRRYENLMTDALVNPVWYGRLMEHCLARTLDHARAVARAKPDAVSFAGNLAGGAVGAVFFERFVLPYELKVMEFLKEQDIMIIYHNCGNVGNLLPVYRRLPIDIFESLTEYPYGDTFLPQALIILQEKGLMGNIDHIDFLVRATPDEIRDKVRTLLNTVRHHRRFILGTSDYIDEVTPLDNLTALAEAGMEWGRRPIL